MDSIEINVAQSAGLSTPKTICKKIIKLIIPTIPGIPGARGAITDKLCNLETDVIIKKAHFDEYSDNLSYEDQLFISKHSSKLQSIILKLAHTEFTILGFIKMKILDKKSANEFVKILRDFKMKKS